MLLRYETGEFFKGRTYAGPLGPIRVPSDADRCGLVLVGAGSMGRAWRDTIEAAPDVELAGIADIDPAAARGRPPTPGPSRPPHRRARRRRARRGRP